LTPVFEIGFAHVVRRIDVARLAYTKRVTIREACSFLDCSSMVLERCIQQGGLRKVAGGGVDGGRDIILRYEEIVALAAERLGARRRHTGAALSRQPTAPAPSAAIEQPPADHGQALVPTNEAITLLDVTGHQFYHRYRATDRLRPVGTLGKGGSAKLLYRLNDVHRILAEKQDHTHIIRIHDAISAIKAARILGISVPCFDRKVDLGICTPVIGDREQRTRRYRRAEVLEYKRFVQQTMSAHEVVTKLGISAAELRRLRADGSIAAATGRFTGQTSSCRYWLTDVDRLAA